MENKQLRSGQAVVVYGETNTGVPRILNGRIVGFAKVNVGPSKYKVQVETCDGDLWRYPDEIYNDIQELIDDITNLVI